MFLIAEQYRSSVANVHPYLIIVDMNISQKSEVYFTKFGKIRKLIIDTNFVYLQKQSDILHDGLFVCDTRVRENKRRKE